MSKKSLIEREKKRLTIYIKNRTLRTFIISKIKYSASFEEKFFYNRQLQKLSRNSSLSRIKNRCSITGRSKGYFRFFGLSRHVLREMYHHGLLSGVTKASW
uniref:Small ribosomal subunit protein uS14c n=1 Tax=Euglenaformis proxima TaxID=299110 RepID=A0A023HHX9_9EUGL|nr:ribosomal protein S14 [Euglenaformis proxima]AGL12013.1 ribosomal protein S14 [Euglenaformis proxima]